MDRRRNCRLAAWILVAFSLSWLAGAKILDEETVTTTETQAVAGTVAKLPCDILPPLNADKVYLVIWYKEGAVSPIYSFDARSKPLEQAKHWTDEQVLGARAFFRYGEDPAKLTIDSVRDTDGGVYRCRVDFKKSPTRNTKVNLTVIIPPEKLVILDDKGSHVAHYTIGPYNEGTTADVLCIATGGRPPPRVTWWLENALLDDSYETLGDSRVQNSLRLERLQRRQLNTVFTCQASNNNLVAPISSAVTLDMNLRPLWVRILGENKPLSADNNYEIQCEAVGSRPPPVITWWKGSVPLRSVNELKSKDGNVTTSTLTFMPGMEDGGKILTCRASNALIADSTMEDTWVLNIHHVPVVNLELGSNLNASTIREGVDVYFDCSIKSNPWVYKVSWRHGGKPLFNNASTGTIVSNQSLVLQSVTRSRAGLYTCVASNKEGDGVSNPVYLDVKYAPVCRPAQQKVYGVARQEMARVMCEVDANPPDVVFGWRFNNTAEAVDIQSSHIASDRTRSFASYVPMTELDYGTLLCSGRNELGAQKEPCVFHVIPAGKPDPLHNCTILNQTVESLHVECAEGFDGGLPQEFVMEVYDAATRNLVSNVTSRVPVFVVSGLESGLGFDVSLFASNSKGRSGVARLHAYTLKAAEKRTGWPARPQPPEKCALAHQTATSVTVSCDPPLFLGLTAPGDVPTTYVLQAFDADTRRLVASATSQAAGRLELTDLPADRRGLVLAVRTVTARATSDAVSIYTRMPEPQEHQLGASGPTMLHITPILGVLIGVVLALVLVAAVIVVVMRCRGRGDGDEKECDDGGLGRRSCSAAGDKSCSVPLSKDMDESLDSMDEKNPDIIPQNSDDYQDPDEKAFEKLNNVPQRMYSNMTPRLQSTDSATMYINSNNVSNVPKTTGEVTYVELSHARPHGGVLYASPSMRRGSGCGSATPLRRQEPIVYAQIDVTKKAVDPSSALPLLHPHHLAAYQLPSGGHEASPVDPETPLISAQQHRESMVALRPVAESGLGPSTPTPRMTTTRF